MSRRRLALLLALAAFVAPSTALRCYENDNNKLVPTEESNPEWSYCGFIPADHINDIRVFGMGPREDSMLTYDASFRQTHEAYKVLSVCIHEKYDMPLISPVFRSSEYLFRCVCNYDLCNSPANFPQFLRKF
ncbi:unnamed protein product [Caenorhabditis bovis]|uniref:Uncharacterized protein n=1 Tax=Caenorhabditis bovis TaxID=2654633 RepID=A0A8S1E5C7_9PELO|nr:unnamed protein product [Caenorhabditis bovis]